MNLTTFETNLFEEFTKDFKSRSIDNYKRKLIAFKDYINKPLLNADIEDAQNISKRDLKTKQLLLD